MSFVLEALGINLVDVFGAGRTGRKPAAAGYDFEAPDGCVVAGSASQLRGNRLASKAGFLDRLG